MMPLPIEHDPWEPYHTEYTRRLERDKAIAQRDEAARLFLNERKRTRKLKQELDEAIRSRDMHEKAANQWRESWEKFYYFEEVE
jgi:hypothetical protein